jgi:vacuolar-type H+-ATPase subunit H
VAAATPPATDPAVVGSLKQIKATEAEWDRRLAEAKAASALAVQRHREAAEAAVHAVAQASEADRAQAAERARSQAASEATAIVADGEAAAAKLRSDGKSLAEPRRREILGVVLGPFAPE